MISSCEIIDQQGLRSIVSRHFIYIVKEIQAQPAKRPSPHIYILKWHNSDQQREKFFCKVKGSIFAVHKGRLYLILFMHTLKINVAPAPEGSGNNLGLTNDHS